MVEMGRDFLLNGPYREIISDNPQQAVRFANILLDTPGAKVLVDEEAGQVKGMIAFYLFPHFYSGEMTAMELIWYVDPAERKSFCGIALLRAAERIAREMGARYMQFTAPSEHVGRIYELAGYRPIEIGYQKAL